MLQESDPNSVSRTQKLAAENLGSKDLKHEFNVTEGFVSAIGESGSNELKFYNAHDFSLMQRLELTQEGCVYMTTHSKAHFSIMLVTTNGSIFYWNSRPAKIIQPLAPYFTEIDENQEYIEKEDEFEEELSDEDPNYQALSDDEKKKRKFAKRDIDIETINPYHLCSFTQYSGLKRAADFEG